MFGLKDNGFHLEGKNSTIPRFIASRILNLSILKWFLDYNDNIGRLNKNGSTSLSTAAKNRCQNC